MTNLELNTAIFNKMNDCVTSLLNESELYGSFSLSELQKEKLGSPFDFFEIKIGNFSCKIAQDAIFQTLKRFAEVNGFRVKKFTKEYIIPKNNLGYVVLPKSISNLCKFVSNDDFKPHFTNIRFDFGINFAYITNDFVFTAIPFDYYGKFEGSLFLSSKDLKCVGLNFYLMKDSKNGKFFFQSPKGKAYASGLDIKRLNFIPFMSELKYNPKFILKLDLKGLKSFYKIVKKEKPKSIVCIDFTKNCYNSTLSCNGFSANIASSTILNEDLTLRLFKEDFEAICYSNGRVYANSLNETICCTNNDKAIIAIAQQKAETDNSEEEILKIREEHKKFLSIFLE